MRFVVGTLAVLIIASITDRHYRPTSVGFSQNTKEMIFRVVQQSLRAAENQKMILGATSNCRGTRLFLPPQRKSAINLRRPRGEAEAYANPKIWGGIFTRYVSF